MQYREGCYLDAWDDDKDALRSFAIDRIRRATVLPDTALDIPEAQMGEHYASAYGIFGGKADKVAVLEYGRYELRSPYREARELVMDVLRHGSHVEVRGPDALRS